MKKLNSVESRIYVLRIGVAPAESVYVGATSSPLELRRAQHVQAASEARSKSHHSPLSVRLRAAMSTGEPLAMEELDRIAPGADWESSERFFIKKFRESGHHVLNQADGGLGHPPPQFGPRSAETRRRISEATRGKKKPPRTAEHNANIAAAKLAWYANPANAERIRQHMTRMRESRGPSPLRGVPRDEETKRKIAASLTGKKKPPHSEETKAKMSQAGKLAWIKRRASST